MPKYHIIIRPALDALPAQEDVLNFFDDFCVYWTFSGEKGQSKGDEEFNHYDCVVITQKDIRVDNFKRSILQCLHIDPIYRKNIKVYKITSEERYLWQIGYCLKEGIWYETNIPEDELVDGVKYYTDNVEKFNTKISDYKKTSPDQLCFDYVQWMVEQESWKENSLQTFKEFLLEMDILPSITTFSKIKNSLEEYIDCVKLVALNRKLMKDNINLETIEITKFQ